MIAKAPKRMLKKLADCTQMQVDEKSGILFGTRDGFHVSIRVVDNTFQTLIGVSVCQNGNAPNAEIFEQFVKDQKQIASCNVSGFGVSFLISAGMTGNRSIEKIANVLPVITQFLSQNHFENCCEGCGTQEATQDAYVLNGTEVWMCAGCFQNFARNLGAEQPKRENVVTGIIGALLGGLLGVVAMVVIGQMGYVAALSGILMAVCSLKGYELLAGTMSKKGIVISAILLLVMTYLGNQIDWAVSVMSAFEVDFFTAFRAIPLMLEEGAIESEMFYKGLAMQYVFVLLGAIPTIWGSMRSHTEQSIMHKMQADV